MLVGIPFDKHDQHPYLEFHCVVNIFAHSDIVDPFWVSYYFVHVCQHLLMPVNNKVVILRNINDLSIFIFQV